ncbi:zinc finger protein 3 homolog [Ochlerotatus camptorhynchus]|uniref:zinc finger protein 3 homolog n=1 Tax=Ochlerotatus camptorhynchus TaxID=644619 RepID=UPI0031E01643
MSQICRACGRKHPSDQVPFNDFQDHAQTYFELTSVQLHEHENPDLLKLCQGCVGKLTDFDRFRDMCCQVHWELQQVKVEPKSDFQTLQKEKNAPSSDQDEVEYDDRKPPEMPFTTMLFVTSEEGVKDEFLSEEELEEIVTPKKERAKYGSKKKLVQPVQYSCDKCPEVFQDRLLLIAHIRAHAGLAPFYCEICKQEFATLLVMKMHHVEKHTERRTLTCDQPGCGQQFGSYQALRHHKTRTHDPNYTGPKPRVYICEHCGDSFGSKQKLTRHKFASHEPQDKPYICEICCLRFTIPYKLKRHMMRHEGIRSHVCPYCGVAKVTKGELMSHMNNVHKKEPAVSNGVYQAAFCGETESTSSIAPSSSKETTQSKPVSKKRKQEEGWVRNVRKNNRNYGKAYVRKDNVLVDGKTFQQQFECGCPRKCRTKFESDAILEQFFDSFWNLGNWHKQNALLSDQVKGVEVNRHRPRDESNPRPERTVSFQYFIPSEHENVRVCQKYFLGILQISSGRLYKCLGRK